MEVLVNSLLINSDVAMCFNSPVRHTFPVFHLTPQHEILIISGDTVVGFKLKCSLLCFKFGILRGFFEDIKAQRRRIRPSK